MKLYLALQSFLMTPSCKFAIRQFHELLTKNIFYLCALILILCFGNTTKMVAQSPSVTTSRDTVSKVKIDYADEFIILQQKDTLVQKLAGSVELSQDSIFMYCDSATITNNTQVLAQGNVIIQQGDSLSIFADSVEYDGVSKLATLFSEVVLNSKGQKLFTEQLNYDLQTKVATYFTGALLTNDTTQLTSKKGYFYTQTDEVYFKDSVVVIDPEFNLLTDSLKYNTRLQLATFLSPTLIKSDSVQVYCEEGFYDTVNEIAEFRVNAQFEKKEQKAKANIIRYDGTTGRYTLSGNAYFSENDRKATADTIEYDERTEETFLIGNARYQDSTQVITAQKIIYDAKNDIYRTRGRSYISDPPQILEADQVDYESETGFGIAMGNVIWRDTTEQITIRTELARYEKKSDYLKASGGRPLMISIVDGDSLFLAADTLLALSRRDSVVLDSTVRVDTSRVLIAYPDVRVFKSDLQAICDSLIYSTRDSIFRFFVAPIIWSDTSQFSADTVLLSLKNEKIDRIYLLSKSFILNSPDEIYFNQIKGKDIIASFEESELRQMAVDGSAESVYYAVDETKAYVGVNKTVCSKMLLYFGNNEIERIKFYTQPTAKLEPMRQADHGALKLDGFNWQIEKRPRAVGDLLTPRRQIEVVPAVEATLEAKKPKK